MQKSAAFKAGYRTIADLGRARIKRAGERINSERTSELNLKKQAAIDLGFKAYNLSLSNFKVWQGDMSDAELGEQIEMHVDHLSKASSAEDVLYELLLKAGFPLTTKVQSIEMAGKAVFSIEDGALLICLEKEITPELIDALAEANPLAGDLPRRRLQGQRPAEGECCSDLQGSRARPKNPKSSSGRSEGAA